MNNSNILRFLSLTGIIILAVITRFVPHPPNFTPVLSIALFGGAYYSDKRNAFIVPIIIMLLSDIFLGFHATILPVYLSFVIIAAVGLFLRNKISILNIAAGSLIGSLIFFIITNLGVWMFSGMYSVDSNGLMLCFWNAVPFFRNTLFSSLVYSGVMFGGFTLAERYYHVLQYQK